MAAVIGLIIGVVVGNVLWHGEGGILGGILGFIVGAAIGARRKARAARAPTAYPPTSIPDPARIDASDPAGAPIVTRAAAGTSPPAPFLPGTANEAALAQRVIALERRLATVEPRLAALERAQGIVGEAIEPPAPPPAETIAPVRLLDLPPVAEAPPLAAARAAADATTSTGATATPAGIPAYNPDGTLRIDAPAMAAAAAPAETIDDAGPPPPPDAPNPVWAWITGGNPMARIGVVLLFIGVGFLLKYTIEQVYVPISVRLAGVALGGIVLLALGWRLRESRFAYAMALQGGGIGILYLTVFAALRLYSMVPPLAAFAIMVWISATSSWLAIKQDAIALAALSVVGGFLAPILTSSNTGSHVMLFSYYALLNAGILGIAWFKAWRSLNLLGFAFTFIIGTLWGVTRYRPENFATTEPFLILFFLFYVAIAVLYALRRSVEVKGYVDGAIVFGTPLVVAGLQSALVRDVEYAMAYSALAMSALYLALTRMLWNRHGEGLRLLVETFLALGVLFATLAVPLGLDARWTTAVWALEGAAAVWVGLRQQRRVVRAFGLLLQVGAGVAFVSGLQLWTSGGRPGAIPILNSAYTGCLFVSLAGLYTAWIYQRRRDEIGAFERAVAPIAFAWGTLWWLTGGWREIDRFVVARLRLDAMLGLLTFTGVVFALLERRLAWPIARVPALALLPLLLGIAVEKTARRWLDERHLFADYGWIAWPIAIAAVVWMLRRFDRTEDDVDGALVTRLDFWHAGLLWLGLLVVAQELAWVGGQIGYGNGAWAVVPWGLVPALGLAAVCALAGGASWPIGAHRDAYTVIGGVPITVFLILWSLLANVAGDGDPTPLPYLPILNPLDLTQCVVFVALGTWLVHIRRDAPQVLAALPARTATVILTALVFYWINLTVLRTIHFWFDVPYTPHALWRSTIVQATLSLLWSVMALATMVFANRRHVRAPWIAGAVLLAVVVVKLFVVELSQVGTVARIVSFIGVGLLVLVIGYLAPVPDRRPEGAP
jgi:uncharacterized membrane protein